MRSRRLGTLTSNFSEEKANDAGGGGSQAHAGPGGHVGFCLKWNSLFEHITLFKLYIQVAECSRTAWPARIL